MPQDYFLMHPAQRDIYFAELIHTNSSQFNIGIYIVLKGGLNVSALHQAVASLPTFFDAFKMRFDFNVTDTAYKIDQEYIETELVEADFSKQHNPHYEAKLWIQHRSNTPFNLNYNQLPFEYFLVKLSEKEHWFVMVFHHLINDGYGVAVTVDHIADKYAALVKGEIFAPSYPSYHREIDNANKYFNSEYYLRSHDYWCEKINKKPQKLLNKKYPAHKSSGALNGTYVTKFTDTDRLFFKDIGAAYKLNLQGLTIAALIIYFGNISSVEEILFGVPLHKRGSKVSKKIVGMFSGALPFKAKFDPNQTVGELLNSIAETQRKDYRHYNYQVGDLSRKLHINSSDDELFDVLINYELLNMRMEFGDDIDAEFVRVRNDSGRVPLEISWCEYSDKQALQLQIRFSYAYFTSDEIALLRDRILHIIKAFDKHSNEPLHRLGILPEAEIEQLSLFSVTQTACADKEDIVSLFKKQVDLYGGDEALVFGNESMSYEALDKCSDIIMQLLLNKGVTKGSLVTVCMQRGMEMIVSILGILKAGGAYVPVDPSYPQGRISYILEDTSSAIILTDAATNETLKGLAAEVINVCDYDEQAYTDSIVADSIKLSGEDLAYVIYTSGSTGRPKGVMVEHRGVVNLAHSQADALLLKPSMRTLQFSSLGFDASCYEIFNTLLTGGCLVLCEKEKLLSASELTQVLEQQNVSLAVLPPSFQQTLTSFPKTLKTIVSAGEPLNEQIAKDLQKRGIRVINAYGPTESTVCATLTDKPFTHEGLVTIGKPMRNTSIIIQTERGSLSPIGIPGEIWIGGAGVARGYLNSADLTAEKFITRADGNRYYRTGDIGRWLSDGNIEYLGRKDDQVKIRGYRIEPGEIEGVLLQSGLLKQAVVLAVPDEDGGKRLTGYLIPESVFDKDALEGYLRTRLPEYMIPRQWVNVEKMPLTAHGKIDKQALLQITTPAHEQSLYVEPRTATERQLAEIWQLLLGIEKVSITDNFFELGGHSLLAMRLVSQLHEKNGLDITIREIFKYPCLSEMGAQLRNTDIERIPAITRPPRIPLSYSQERLYFIDRLEGSLQYHIPLVLLLNGQPDAIALEKAFRKIVDRHEILRSVILEEDGQGYQVVKPNGQWHLKQSFQSNANVNSYISKQLKKRFDLSADDMLRAELINTGERQHILVLEMHHIASDGWSMSLLIKELFDFYKRYADNELFHLPDPKIQYADYAIWQRRKLTGDALKKKINYWTEKLSGTSLLNLPTDRKRPLIQSNNGGLHKFTIPSQITSNLNKLSLANTTTLFMTLLSAFKVLLSKYSGQYDICVGSPVANRNQHEITDSIGFFVNTVALRSKIAEDMSFVELLDEVKQNTLSAYEHQDAPFEKVVESVVKDRDLSRTPLFQVVFAFLNTPAIPKLLLGAMEAITAPLQDIKSKYDITLNIDDSGEELNCTLEYNTDIYDSSTIKRMGGHYLQLINSVLSNPSQKIADLNILNEAEIEQLSLFSVTQTACADKEDIVSLFKKQVDLYGGDEALVFGNESMSYEALDKCSDIIMQLLLNKGVTKGSLVTVCMQRGMEMIVSILGIIKAGGAYVPVDPSYPQGRISYILEDTSSAIILTDAATNETLKGLAAEVINVCDYDEQAYTDSIVADSIKLSGEDLAYVIYTSGSTGRPKGVMVEHRGVVSLVSNAGYVNLSHSDTLLATGSPSFDATTFEYWGMLLNGGKLVLCSDDHLADSIALRAAILAHKVNIMWFTASWFNQLADHSPEVFQGLKTLVIGGEKLSVTHVKKVRQYYPDLTLINGYGPTEGTTFSLTYIIGGEFKNDIIPIGHPLNNRTAQVVDAYNRQVPIGIPGEIWIGGAGVARGYLNSADLTAEKFITRADGNRYYRTGDIGRWLSDGNIEYLGRKDDQVKIRGYRIEPGEIEGVLLQSGLLKQAVVLAVPDEDGGKRLTGYLIPESVFDKDALEGYLRTRLPEYMIPRQWVNVEKMPLTAHGKIDKQALLQITTPAHEQSLYVEPRTATERQLAEIWQLLLGIEKVSITDNFFELGGHSLLAMRLVSHIRRTFAVSIPISAIFQFPSLDLLGQYLTIQNRNLANTNKTYKVVDL